MRLLAIPYSTNCERVLLALGVKGLEVEIEVVDQDDRSRVRDVSGQDLVPVLTIGDLVLWDSPEILRHLDETHPSPRLYPTDPRARAEAEIFVQWFNQVWKGPPNEIDRLRHESPDPDRIQDLARWLAASIDLFDALLHDRPYLLGPDFGIADCVAFPFLKYGAMEPAPDDPDTFHRVLADYLVAGPTHPRLRDWIRRVDALPRAGSTTP